MTYWYRDVFTSWNFCSHDTMHLHHVNVSTKFEANQSKNIVTVTKNVISPPFATQHQNLDIKIYHYMHLYHTYHVSKFKKDQLSNEKFHITCMLKANTLLTVRTYCIISTEFMSGLIEQWVRRVTLTLRPTFKSGRCQQFLMKSLSSRCKLSLVVGFEQTMFCYH